MPVVTKQTNAVPSMKTPTKKKTGTILDRIEDISFDENEGIKIMLYGRSGTGKTTLWSSFPAPILAIVISGGKKPGELRSVNTAENRGRIKQIKLNSSGDLKELIDELPTSDFKTVVVDHITGLQDRILAEILGIEEIPAQMGWGIARQQDWGQCGLQLKEIGRSLLSLSQNVVIVGHERDSKGESNSDLLMPTIGVALTPSAAGWFNGAVDYIVNTFIKQKEKEQKVKIGKEEHVTTVKVKGEVEYLIRTGPDPIYTTKFRVPRTYKLPEYIVDPSYDKIMKVIKGQK